MKKTTVTTIELLDAVIDQLELSKELVRNLSDLLEEACVCYIEEDYEAFVTQAALYLEEAAQFCDWKSKLRKSKKK